MAITYLQGTSVPGNSVKSQLWEPPKLWDWMAQVEDAPKWLLDGVMPADSQLLVSGRAKRSNKTWLAFTMGLAVATGQTIGPFKPVGPAAPILVLEAEGSRAFTRRRWEMLGKGLGVPIQDAQVKFSHREPILLDNEEWIARVSDLVARTKTRLVIVDPFVNFSSGDENSVEDVQKVFRAFMQFQELGASVMFVHHIGKTAKDFVRDIDEEIRGTSAFSGRYDVHYAVRQPPFSLSSASRLTVRAKDFEEKQYEIEWFIDSAQGTATFELLELESEEYRDKIWAELETLLRGGDNINEKRVRELFGLEDAGTFLAGLVEAGMLFRKGNEYGLP